jgi:Zn-dependent membrane protease YugP
LIPGIGLLLFLVPALVLAVAAQIVVRSAYARTRDIAARTSGYAAARRVLDAAGLHDIDIEQVPGTLSDHYDPRHKVLRLSADVFHGRSLAAVGIAAHEAGHALQQAAHYGPLTIRNAAMPAASYGSSAAMLLLVVGLALWPLLLLGVILFSAVVFLQLVNLPVEFNASARARSQLVELGIVEQGELPWVRQVLDAAALTDVAATVQSVLALIDHMLRFLSRRG